MNIYLNNIKSVQTKGVLGFWGFGVLCTVTATLLGGGGGGVIILIIF